MGQANPKLKGDAAVSAIFGGAPAADTKKVTTGKKTTARDLLELGSDFDVLAAAKVLAKATKGIMEQLTEELKGKALDQFSQEMFLKKSKPSTVNVCGNKATGRIQPSKRRANVALHEEVVNRLQDMGVPLDKHKRVEQRYVLNPAILENQALLVHLAELLAGDRQLAKAGITQPILLQQEESHYAPSEATFPILAEKAETWQDIRGIIEELVTVTFAAIKLDGVKHSGAAADLAIEILQESELL